MLHEERISLILNQLNRKNAVTVKELASLCNVTTETIRSDLKKLEKMNLLTYKHGGAIRTSLHDETPHLQRELTNKELKVAIARSIVNEINMYDQIILDSSSTSLCVAQALPNMPITILTNSLLIQNELASKNEIEVIAIGGTLLRSSLCYVGYTAALQLSNYHTNKAFLSCRGIHHTMGASEPNELAVVVKQKMLEISDVIYLMMDSTKFGIQDFIQVATLDAFSYIYTDSNILEAQLAPFEPYKTKIRVCPIAEC
jgi:DeoR/GlpR family transcriptional regulator of sugar metabolism